MRPVFLQNPVKFLHRAGVPEGGLQVPKFQILLQCRQVTVQWFGGRLSLKLAALGWN